MEGKRGQNITFSQTSATVWRILVILLQKNHSNMDNDRGQSLITKYVWVIETIYRRRKISFFSNLCHDLA